jgi:hypothetical protein
MADETDLEAAIVGLIVAAVYPNGTTQPSVVGQTISVERGWPTEADIRNATAAGTQLIRVYAVAGMSRDAERYQRLWQSARPATPSLTATLEENIVTLSGTVTAGLIASVQSRGLAYNHLCAAGDTLTSIAAAFAGVIPGASSAGAVLTLPTTGPLPFARVLAGATATMEVGRQQQVFAISSWATTPVLRDQIFQSLGPTLALNYRITLPDGSIATRIGRSFQTGGPNDVPSRANVWQRDLRLTWDFPLIVSMDAPPAAAISTSIVPNDASSPAVTVLAR